MEVIGLSETLDALREVCNEKIKQAQTGVKLAGQAYANDVKALAPYDTGTLRRSIHLQAVTEEGGQFYAIVGTDVPYARRQEYGFYDKTDSLGRHFMQPGKAYFRPPLDTEMNKYVRIMQGVFDESGWASDLATLAGIRPDLLNSTIPTLSTPSVRLASTTSAASRYAAIGGTMQGDFGGFE